MRQQKRSALFPIPRLVFRSQELDTEVFVSSLKFDFLAARFPLTNDVRNLFCDWLGICLQSSMQPNYPSVCK